MCVLMPACDIDEVVNVRESSVASFETQGKLNGGPYSSPDLEAEAMSSKFTALAPIHGRCVQVPCLKATMKKVVHE